MNYNTLLELYNEFASEVGCEEIFHMDDLDEILGGLTPSEIVSRVGDNFNIHEDYFQYNGLGFINSYGESEIKYFLDVEMGDYFGEWLEENGHEVSL